ncbi:hypothetical protein Dsi01nite_079450 [Dactylosporangium siamense]|uniref:Blue (type 1) copper domain-containing protein n=1 Tax=Dactylosporangium siamense TaxID=685454 RepID=A0A919PTH7_9ACTN|nr:plastocyanin/azurin family copper-binding protein [Dactylosporangium siamense]GIG49904.1 hypothetical protein Dsi01nite_079450 [Dactylosporangium siamense]
MIRRALSLVGVVVVLLSALVSPASAADQVLTWTTDGEITRYKTAPATAVAGAATIVFENSTATGNTTGMPHTLTFDTSAEGYNHDVNVNILANPFDANNGRHQVDVVLTPGRYRYFCSIPGHSLMVGELVVTGTGGGDTTPPTVTASVSGDGTAAATVTVTATDADSGVASVEYQLDDTGWSPYTAPVRVTSPGDHTVLYRATDTAGNTSAVGSVAFSVDEPGPVDTTPPAVTATVSGDGTAAATVTVTATDAGSGVASVAYQLDGGAWLPYSAPVVVTTPGSHMLHHRATDVAGNTSPEGMVMFTVVLPDPVDTTPPTVTATVTGTFPATVTVTATDAQSGVASISYRLDGGEWTAYTAPVVVSAPGVHSVSYRATDRAGNVSSAQSAAFTVTDPGTDACPNSDDRPTVVIGGVDSGVSNVDTGNGCTVNDLIAEHASYPSHAAFVRHVDAVTAPLVTAGVLTRRDQGAIVRAASRSSVPSLTPRGAS